MYTISGKVLVRETGQGIADLQVVFYELEPGATSVNELLASLRDAARAVGALWDRIRGERLGSVLTARDGTFQVSFDAAPSDRVGMQRRRDLLLLVLAPHDAYAGEGAPEQLLYAVSSHVPRDGATESFAIRIPRESIDRLGPRAQRRSGDVKSIVDAMERAYALEQSVQAKTTELTRRKVAPALERQRRVSQAFENFSLSKYPNEFRSSAYYVAQGEQVATKQDQAVDRQLEKIPQLLDSGVERN
jgi:hypothetical protein